jgi:hypothetical protein
MILYRLTEYYCGSWHDIKESGETFDFETEKEVRTLLKNVNYRTGRGYKMNYREVSEREQEDEWNRYASYQVNMMFYEG